MEKEKIYDFEKAVENSEKENTVSTDAVLKAKENIEKKKLDEAARKIENRLTRAEEAEKVALKEVRMSRRKAELEKDKLTAINVAKAELESSGDTEAYDDAIEKANEEYDRELSKAKRKIYGDEYWRY